jgi:hypothetical protein
MHIGGEGFGNIYILILYIFRALVEITVDNTS